MASLRILLMRHAEKPEDPLDPGLSPAGHARAEKLAAYIPKTFGMPDFLFAAAVSKHSERPYQTLKPLSREIDLSIDTAFTDQDYEGLGRQLLSKERFAGKLVVVCWHHGYIPSFADVLKAKPGAYPDPWDPAVFNLVLRFEMRDDVSSVEPIIEPF